MRWISAKGLRPSEHTLLRNMGAFSDDLHGGTSAVIPCLTGQMLFSLIRCGYLDDPRVQKGIDWIVKYQRFDDGETRPPKEWPYKLPILHYGDSCWGKHTCHNGAVLPLSALSEIPKGRIINRTIKRLKDLSRIAYKQDINIGFEFINLPNSSIATLDDAIEVLRPLESQENVGYIIDTFNLAKSGADINKLGEIKDYLFLIQLGDMIYDPNSKSEDLLSIKESNRVFPGRGNYDFTGFFMLYRNIPS